MSKINRTKRVIKTVCTSLLNNGLTIICGLIVPRLILRNYGSAYNGVIQSISQFISYISLMQAGIGGATTAALYKPLANGDMEEVSEILASTEKFMRKICLIFVIFIVCFAIVYPTWIVTDFDWFFTAALIVVISLSTFAQYYFGFTYQCLINADQKGYIITYLNMFVTIFNAIIEILLINGGFGILAIKLGSSIVNVVPSIFIYLYVRKEYKLIRGIKPKEDKIPQKWNAAAHEVASFVNDNTNIIVLSLFADIKDVSVYTVYNYVVSNIKKIVTNFTVGFGAAFGDMYAKNEIDLMKKNLGIYETIIFSLTTMFCSVALVMMLPFVKLYTKGVTDVNYNLPVFSILITIACAFNCFRVPYRSIVYSVGHYKETRNGAIFESVMHIVVSVFGVIKFGVVGIALGSLCAMSFRTFQYALYLSKNILDRDIKIFLKRLLISFGTMIIVYFISKAYMVTIRTWPAWVMYALVTTLLSLSIIFATDFIFFAQDTTNFILKVKKIMKKTF